MGDTPSWADFLAATTAKAAGCPIDQLLNGGAIPSTLRPIVAKVIGDNTGAHPADTVVSELRRRLGDRAPSLNALRQHRRGKCSCPSQ